VLLAGVCAGCAAAGAVGLITQVAPEVAMGSAQLVGIQASAKDSAGGISNADNPDKCEQLVRAQPGVEEIRKTKDGVIESRQWKIAETSGDPILDSRAHAKPGHAGERMAAEARRHQAHVRSTL